MTDPLEARLRRLHPSALPEEVQERLAAPPPRESGARRKIIQVCFAAAAAAAVIALLLRSDPPVVNNSPPVQADTSTRRVQDARPLAVVTEGRRAWEVVEVTWVDEATFVTTGGAPLAVQATNSHRTLVPVEIMLD